MLLVEGNAEGLRANLVNGRVFQASRVPLRVLFLSLLRLRT
jgi:hypothetical protein